MGPGLSEDDLRRIEAFVRTPPHRRQPHLLAPSAQDSEDEGEVEKQPSP
jgi:hypothetical protein